MAWVLSIHSSVRLISFASVALRFNGVVRSNMESLGATPLVLLRQPTVDRDL